MIKRYNRLSFVFGIPGIALQILGMAMRFNGHDLQGRMVAFAGIVLLIIGLALYAKALGRNPAWGILGVLSIFGLLILASLSDYSETRTETNETSGQ